MTEKLQHKPNTKHTLEEILKSLQDLIRNDLLEAEPGRGADEASSPSEKAPAATSSAQGLDQDLSGLRDSLEHLVQEELTPDRVDASLETALESGQQEDFLFDNAPAAEPETIEDDGSLDLDSTLANIEVNDETVAPDEMVEESRFEAVALPSEPEIVTLETHVEPELAPPVEVPPATDSLSRQGGSPEPETATSPEAEALLNQSIDVTADTAYDATPAEAGDVPISVGDWDDIPVLDDEVLEELGYAEEVTRVAAPADASKRGTNMALPLPAPSRAHDLAVKAVARLNIELRKSGKRPLDPKVIARLAMTLRETLESDTIKKENKGHP
ncbi:MAG: hypothetical protein JSW09_00835 [Pseudomonadota bacterium]|nr:MAG: hypothetical protein JSW09_00835 [Pseudomonadota bacterium]